MFPLRERQLIRGALAHTLAGLGKGADYVAYYTELYAPFDGTIETYSGWQGGNWSRLTRDNGDVIEFAHLDRYDRRIGRVDKGELIATTGNTGAITTGAHLHIQIKRDGVRLDPEKYDWEDNMKPVIQIQVIRKEDEEHKERIDTALFEAYNWFRDRGVEIDYNVSDGHFKMITQTHPTGYNAGNALWESKTVNFYVGNGDPALTPRMDWQVVVHEIQHMMWYEVGLGCMHDCVGADPTDSQMAKNYSNYGFEYILNKFLALYNPTKHFIIKGDNKKKMKLIIHKNEQYLRNEYGDDYHIVNPYTLKELKKAGLVDNEVAEPVSVISDTGLEFLVAPSGE